LCIADDSQGEYRSLGCIPHQGACRRLLAPVVDALDLKSIQAVSKGMPWLIAVASERQAQPFCLIHSESFFHFSCCPFQSLPSAAGLE